MALHHKQIQSEQFNDILMGVTPFILQRDDETIKVGDTLYLYEWAGDEFTGRKQRTVVISILRSAEGLKEGYCIIGLKDYIR